MKKLVISAVAAIVASAWASLIFGFFLDVDRNAWIIWVTAVAIITEAAIWVVAATLGVAVFQARKAIWRWVSRPFRSADDQSSSSSSNA